MLVFRRCGRVQVADRIPTLEDVSLVPRRMPQLVVDRVRGALRAEPDLLKRQAGQQVSPLRKLADQKEMFKNVHRIALYLPMPTVATGKPPNGGLVRGRVQFVCVNVV